MSILDMLVKLVQVANGLVLLIKTCKTYITDQQKKKDSSRARQHTDESNESGEN